MKAAWNILGILLVVISSVEMTPNNTSLLTVQRSANNGKVSKGGRCISCMLKNIQGMIKNRPVGCYCPPRSEGANCPNSKFSSVLREITNLKKEFTSVKTTIETVRDLKQSCNGLNTKEISLSNNSLKEISERLEQIKTSIVDKIEKMKVVVEGLQGGGFGGHTGGSGNCVVSKKDSARDGELTEIIKDIASKVQNLEQTMKKTNKIIEVRTKETTKSEKTSNERFEKILKEIRTGGGGNGGGAGGAAVRHDGGGSCPTQIVSKIQLSKEDIIKKISSLIKVLTQRTDMIKNIVQKAGTGGFGSGTGAGGSGSTASLSALINKVKNELKSDISKLRQEFLSKISIVISHSTSNVGNIEQIKKEVRETHKQESSMKETISKILKKALRSASRTISNARGGH